MTTRSTYVRRLGAVALGVGLGLLAFGFASAVSNDPTTDDRTANEAITTDATEERVSGTESEDASAPTVAGITVTREQRRPVDDTDDYSMMIIGAGMAVTGGASLRLSHRAAAAAGRPYRPRHRR